MISNEKITRAHKNIDAIAASIDKYSSMSREQLMDHCVKERLQLAVNIYDGELEIDVKFLSEKAAERVLKAMEKTQKYVDRAIIAKHFVEGA